MYRSQSGKQAHPVPQKVGVDPFIGIVAQKFSHDLQRQHLTIPEGRLGAAQDSENHVLSATRKLAHGVS